MSRQDRCPVCGDLLTEAYGVPQCWSGVCNWPERMEMLKMMDKEHDSVTPEGEVGQDTPDMLEQLMNEPEPSLADVYERLGWTGQHKLLTREGALPVHPVDKFVYDMLLPHQTEIQEFDAYLLPDDIQSQIEPYLEEDFEKIVVQYNVENRAGVILGVRKHPERSWAKQYYGIVEWGLPKAEPDLFEHGRMELAKLRANNKLLSEALKAKGEIEALIDYLEGGIEGKALSFYMQEDGTRRSAYVSLPSM